MNTKEELKKAYLQIDMIHKNIINAINNGLKVDYSIEPKDEGTFIIMVSSTDLLNTPK